MAEKSKIPEIRFKEFSGEWEERELGNLCLIGDIDHRMPATVTEGIPYLMTGSFVENNGLDFENSKLISIQDYEQLSKKIKPEAGDLLFARYASVGSVRYVETKKKFLISYSCAIIKHNKSINGKYLFNYVQSNKVQSQIELNINTGSQRNIGIDSLNQLIITLPKREREQEAIANFLTRNDTLITLHQKKYDKLLNLKKAMLEKMFPKKGADVPEIRFKGFSEKWEEKELGNYANFRRGSFPQPYGNKEWYDGKGSMPFVQVVDVTKKLLLVQNTKQKISTIAQPKSVFVEKGKVLVTLQGSIGRVAIAQYNTYVDRTLLIFENYNEKTDTRFWAYLMQEKFNLEKRKAPGGTIKTITKDALSKFQIVIPKYTEQTKIGNYFENLDKLLSLHEEELKKLKNIKKACLEKMFV
ncbi:MAG: restriction endonuclease subunit S [Arcobacter sp.]|nr:MAG: restriction endonuclease subunit S [Arcobacter sp.]